MRCSNPAEWVVKVTDVNRAEAKARGEIKIEYPNLKLGKVVEQGIISTKEFN